MMARKIILLWVIAGLLLIPLKSVNAAENDNINHYPNYTIVTEKEEKLIEIKNRKVERGYLGDVVIITPSEEQIQMMDNKKTNNGIKNDGQVGTMYVPTPDGTTQILTVAPYSNGTLIQQDYKSGIASTIWNTSMYVAGKF
ncbi:hypothetical protein [Tepidibacillus marianensis]|uniref:hypothetical protein n=1 Tax=Tepidibacillus marianensis TaxID=3131995 RepID=UPI0030D552F2